MGIERMSEAALKAMSNEIAREHVYYSAGVESIVRAVVARCHIEVTPEPGAPKYRAMTPVECAAHIGRKFTLTGPGYIADYTIDGVYEEFVTTGVRYEKVLFTKLVTNGRWVDTNEPCGTPKQKVEVEKMSGPEYQNEVPADREDYELREASESPATIKGREIGEAVLKKLAGESTDQLIRDAIDETRDLVAAIPQELYTLRENNRVLLTSCKAAREFIEHEYRNRTLTTNSPVVKLVDQLRAAISKATARESEG